MGGKGSSIVMMKKRNCSDIARNIPNNGGVKKNKSCIVPFYCKVGFYADLSFSIILSFASLDAHLGVWKGVLSWF